MPRIETVAKYLASLPADRRAALNAVRAVFKKHLDPAFEEGIQYGMIGWYLPHKVYPAGYHGDPSIPLPFASLASRKDHMTLGLMSVYGDATEKKKFESAWKKTGKKLDMGAACVRFKSVDDLALDVIAATLRRTPAKAYIKRYETTIRTGSHR